MIMEIFANLRAMSFSKIEDIEKRTFYYLCGFSFFLPLSKAVGNIFLALALLGMAHRLFLKNDDVKIIFNRYKEIFATIFLLLAAVFISALTSADIFLGVKKFVEKYILHIAIMLPPLFISCDRKKLFTLAKLLLIGVFISNFIVVAQGFLNFDKEWRFGGVLGVMPQGSLLAMFLPIYAVLIMHVKSSRLKIFLIISAVVGFTALLFNGTRGVWLATLILIPAVILIYTRNKIKSLAVILAMLAVAGGIFFVTPNLHERFSTITDMHAQSNSERLLMWRSAINMFEDNPIFGVGYGQYKFAYQNEYIAAEARERFQEHAHNNFLQMLAECGIVGAAAFIFLWGYFSYLSLKIWFKEKNIAGLLFFCVLWGMMLHGLTEFNFETSTTSKIFWYALGLYLASKIKKISA